MPKAKPEPKSAYELLISGDIDKLRNYAVNRIRELQEGIDIASKEQKILRMLLALAETCTEIAQYNVSEAKKSKLRTEWKEIFDGCWSSEAGSVSKKAWGKFEGLPGCWRDRAPYGEDDRSSGNMVHRSKQGNLDDRTTDFDTLIDCQLAVEQAHFESLEKNTHSK